MVSSYGQGARGPRRYGLQAAVSRGGGPFRPLARISPTGVNQVAAAQGPTGVFTAFDSGAVPIGTLAYSRLAPGATAFTAPRILDRSERGEPVLAGNPRGDVALAWNDAPRGAVSGASYSVRAATGGPAGLSRPHTIAPGRDEVAVATLGDGIDRRGDAIVVWNGWANLQPEGVFAAIFRR